MANEESDDTDSKEAPPAPRPKRRKKRRAAAAAEASAAVRELPSGWPAFARGYPAEPALDRLVEAFERGNYAAVRAGAPRLVREAEAEEVRRAAEDLLRRTRPDPLAVTLLLAAAGLLVFLAAWYWSHNHGP